VGEAVSFLLPDEREGREPDAVLSDRQLPEDVSEAGGSGGRGSDGESGDAAGCSAGISGGTASGGGRTGRSGISGIIAVVQEPSGGWNPGGRLCGGCFFPQSEGCDRK